MMYLTYTFMEQLSAMMINRSSHLYAILVLHRFVEDVFTNLLNIITWI